MELLKACLQCSYWNFFSCVTKSLSSSWNHCTLHFIFFKIINIITGISLRYLKNKHITHFLSHIYIFPFFEFVHFCTAFSPFTVQVLTGYLFSLFFLVDTMLWLLATTNPNNLASPSLCSCCPSPHPQLSDQNSLGKRGKWYCVWACMRACIHSHYPPGTWEWSRDQYIPQGGQSHWERTGFKKKLQGWQCKSQGNILKFNFCYILSDKQLMK